MGTALSAGRVARIVGGLALLASLSGCISMLEASLRAEGFENDLVVHALSSLDDAWFVPGRGLVVYGKATPGQLFGDVDPPGGRQPSVAPFAAALSLEELAAGTARLPYDRFYGVSAEQASCAGKASGARRVSVSTSPGIALLGPELPVQERDLEQQHIQIDALPGVTERPVRVELGPRGAKPIYYAVAPFALVSDLLMLPVELVAALYTGVVAVVAGESAAPPPEMKPTDPCVTFASLPFPPSAAMPAVSAD
jgi:hypothetical protein